LLHNKQKKTAKAKVIARSPPNVDAVAAATEQ
jgi:hypothetical protein